jgi:hypothetical protein
MKRLNTNGFSALELIIIVVIVGLIGGAGYYVNSSREGADRGRDDATKSQSEPQAAENKEGTKTADNKDVAAGWTVFTSSKGWTMKIPDGWILTTGLTSEGLITYGSELTYKPGTPAVIGKQDGGRGGPFLYSVVNFAAGDPGTANPEYLTDESNFAAANVSGKKYVGVLKEDYNMDGSKGDTVYRYVFVKGSKSVIVNYLHSKDKPSYLNELELSVKTLTIN